MSLRAHFAPSGLMLMEDERMHKDAILTGSRDALGDMQGGRLVFARSRIEIRLAEGPILNCFASILRQLHAVISYWSLLLTFFSCKRRLVCLSPGLGLHIASSSCTQHGF